MFYYYNKNEEEIINGKILDLIKKIKKESSPDELNKDLKKEFKDIVKERHENFIIARFEEDLLAKYDDEVKTNEDNLYEVFTYYLLINDNEDIDSVLKAEKELLSIEFKVGSSDRDIKELCTELRYRVLSKYAHLIQGDE